MALPRSAVSSSVDHEQPGVLADRPHRYDWSLLGIRWGDVLKYQHWGGLLLFIPAVVITGVSHWTFQQNPVVRQALLYDATISYPHKQDQTIPNSLATLYNWLCLVVAVIIVELLLFRRQHSLTVGITGILHQVWCCAVNFVIILAITEVTKPFSGRLRPDFLARCQPPELAGAPADAGGGSAFPSTLSPNAATLGTLHLGQVAGACNNPDLDIVRDGRLSFPSGHASNSMSVAWFTTLYVMWSLYLRVDAPYPRRLHRPHKHMGIWHRLFCRLIQELWHAMVYAFVLLTLCLSWFIGMTRFWDNVHNISDILGGFLVAIIFTTPYSIKAIGLHTCFKEHIDGPATADGYARKPELLSNQSTASGPLLPVTMTSQSAVGGMLGPGQIGAREHHVNGSDHVSLQMSPAGPSGPLESPARA